MLHLTKLANHIESREIAWITKRSLSHLDRQSVFLLVCNFLSKSFVAFENLCMNANTDDRLALNHFLN